MKARLLASIFAFATAALTACSIQEINKSAGVTIWGQSAAADPTKRSFTRAKAIETHLQGRNLADVEGVWVWADNQYEVVIFRNTAPETENRHPGYDFVGLITDARDERDRREVKLLLKETASPAVYSGVFIDAGGGRHGTAFVMNNKNLIETSVPTGPYRSSQKILLLRMYPKANEPATAANKATGAGTGFFVAPDIVATNYHVVANAREISLRIGKLRLPAELVVHDRQNDLALLKLKSSDDSLTNATLKGSIACASFADAENPKPGQAVYVLGYPLSDMLGSNVTVSQGIINSVVGIKDDPRVLQISVPIQPGNSGSPLFDDQGRVIGVVTSTINNRFLFQTQGVVPQNVNFAVKVAYLKTLLGMTPNQACPDQNSGRFDAAKIQGVLGPAVVAVEIAR